MLLLLFKLIILHFKISKPEEQLPCHLTYTTPGVEKLVKESLHLNCHIQQDTKGPRYIHTRTHTLNSLMLQTIQALVYFADTALPSSRECSVFLADSTRCGWNLRG